MVTYVDQMEKEIDDIKVMTQIHETIHDAFVGENGQTGYLIGKCMHVHHH